MHAPKDAFLDLESRNGPINVGGVSGTLKARAINGPVSLNLPDKFRSGVRLEARLGPINCRAEACAGAFMGAGRGRRTIEWNGASGTIRVSTDNGPISVSGGKLTRTI